jgi:hypothetical protein
MLSKSDRSDFEGRGRFAAGDAKHRPAQIGRGFQVPRWNCCPSPGLHRTMLRIAKAIPTSPRWDPAGRGETSSSGPRHHRPRALSSAGVAGAARSSQTSRQEFAVKTLGNKSRPRRMSAGDVRRLPEKRALGSLRLFGVAGVSRYACEAKYPWPRLHGRRGTSTPPGRDAVSS